MAKAKTRVKFGQSPEKKGERDKSHLKTIQPGETIPKGADVDETTLAAISDEGEEFEPVYDPEDNESFEGEEAARHSKLMAPDNPDRPAGVPGEDAWKVAGGGAFGRESASVMESAEKEAPKSGTKARGGKNSARESGRASVGASTRSEGGTGNASGQSATGDDDK